MTTERRPRLDEQGFTLIEVLCAMLILAIGLLGLEALGIGATRAVNSAGRQSMFAAVASDTLERTLSRIRRGDAVTDGTSWFTTGMGDSVRVVVGTSSVNRLRTVAVTVLPSSKSSRILTRADSLRVVGYVLR